MFHTKEVLLLGPVSHQLAHLLFLLFLDYKWVFSEWAIARGSRAYTSNGHVIRDINLNPNGFAMHCKGMHV